MKTVFNGTEINCAVEEADFSKYIKRDITPYLVWYDSIKNSVTVDERADDSYIKYAAPRVYLLRQIWPSGPYDRGSGSSLFRNRYDAH